MFVSALAVSRIELWTSFVFLALPFTCSLWHALCQSISIIQRRKLFFTDDSNFQLVCSSRARVIENQDIMKGKNFFFFIELCICEWFVKLESVVNRKICCWIYCVFNACCRALHYFSQRFSALSPCISSTCAINYSCFNHAGTKNLSFNFSRSKCCCSSHR